MKIFEGIMLISDMDGTLLNKDGSISEKNIEAIKEFISLGGKFTVATGRMKKGVEKFLDRLPINAPAIIFNGSSIYDFSKHKEIYAKVLENGVKGYLEKIKSVDSSIGIEVYCNDEIYVYNNHKRTERFKKKGYKVHYDFNDDVYNMQWRKVLIVGDKDQLDNLQNVFQEEIGQANIVRSDDVYLEMMPMGTSKAMAVKILCDMLKYKLEDVIAVGDNMNDFDMLKEVGYSFVVENGDEKLKKAIKGRTTDNNNDAIYNLLEGMKFVLTNC
ncbi:Cof-type HAD-IIB family hydrolase [Clostridium bornimense]|uniref:Cof-type HAD-IIB family hydrolase n=1 Tax=Clostridium bornimense TaxID=1216932 RepID=UPI001C126204|nr:Cof-type HAD-IIB family hydrolase [Clostridium bornimense]MBU5315698.1 Cof-type HAD-IIB family hydrolase [Clostridium bornimense]